LPGISVRAMTSKIFNHPALGEKVESISGHYSFLREGTLDYKGRNVLYHSGYGVIDSSCCGVGGCVFCQVAGYVLRRHDGDSVRTEVEPIADPAERDEITDMLKNRESCTQVNFF